MVAALHGEGRRRGFAITEFSAVVQGCQPPDDGIGVAKSVLVKVITSPSNAQCSIAPAARIGR